MFIKNILNDFQGSKHFHNVLVPFSLFPSIVKLPMLPFSKAFFFFPPQNEISVYTIPKNMESTAVWESTDLWIILSSSLPLTIMKINKL